MARILKFRIKEVEGLNVLCSENKGADQLRDLICVFVFAYARSRLSHDAAHFMVITQRIKSPATICLYVAL